MKIKIATFNVNSIKARLKNVLDWLKNSSPDIVLLQELKCLEEDFPHEQFFDLGYNAAILGQKTYNGVAILSKFKIEDVVKNIPNFTDDLLIKKAKKKVYQDDFFDEDDGDRQQQARYIEAVIIVGKNAIRVASIYVPNGGGEILAEENLEESTKFQYKINFFKALRQHFAAVLQYDEIAIFGGDFNVAAQNIDVYDPVSLAGSVCFHPFEQKEFHAIINLGLTDAYRAFNQQTQAFSWWDYRGNAWQYNKGMRLDYLLTSPLASDKIVNATIEDKDVRDLPKASDHCPVCITIEI
ncbi:MAG TPA: exodeoxyribonuclease III [Rickettsiales bacterium]|nr:exodeoxyribonuclease III [Rickettsiales bacterium]